MTATLESICVAAYNGRHEELSKLIAAYNGPLDLPFTDVNALMMAAIGGQESCAQILLDAGASPWTRQWTPYDVDPNTGDTAKDKAKKMGHDSVVKVLQAAEKKVPEPEAVKWTPPNDEPVPKAGPTASSKATPAEATTKALAKPAQEPLPIALCFPGQGSQYVGMLKATKDLPEVRALLATAQKVLGYDLLELCLNGPEDKLGETRYTQPAMFVAGLAGVAKLRTQREEAVTRAKCCAGLSLGEYTALCFADVLDFEDGLRLVKLRGEAMQEAASIGKQGMLSVIGLDESVLKKLCEEAAKETQGVCKIANYLFPKGFSCAGTSEAIAILQKKADVAKALKTTVLKTSGGFHTELMQPAAEKLARALEETLPKMRPNNVVLYSNVTAKPLAPGTNPKVIVELLKQQLTSSVLWDPSVAAMLKESGIKEFYECGPGKQIKAMMKRINNDVWKNTTNVEV